MSRLKLFVENFIIYGFTGVMGKIIPLIMLPIITRLMPDTFYFGLNDLTTTLISFGQAIAIMGMYDAMFRMFFEKEEEEYKKEICSSALIFTIITSIVVFSCLFLFRDIISNLVYSDEKYYNLVLLGAISILIGATNSIVAAPTRMQNKRKVYMVINIISPILSYSISIPLLIKGYYVIALPIASIVSAIVIETIFYILNRSWFRIRKINFKYIKMMLMIGVPLVPNFLIYWIFNSCDKLMIAKILGNSYTGIYAIGGKFGHISQLIYLAFAGGWQYFSFSTMKDNDQVILTSKIFEYLGIISMVSTIIITSLCHPIFNLFFNGDYINGYIVAPYLFFAPLLQMLFQVGGNQFLIIMKTWLNSLILFIGAIINILVNFALIPYLGIEGAAVATLIGYIISDIVICIVLIRMKLLKISMKFKISSILMGVFMLGWLFIFKQHYIITLLISVMFILFYLILYRKEILDLKHRFFSKKLGEN